MEIINNIHALKHFFQIPLKKGEAIERFVYSYIIFGDYITLIDTGVKGSHEAIYEYIKSKGRNIMEIDKIILSHSHPDHMGSAHQIKKDTNCIVMGHEAELIWFENLEIQFNSRAIPGFFKLLDNAVDVDVLLEDGDRITPTGAEELQILHTPGHSPGSLSIYFAKSKVLFTADAVPKENDIPNYDSYFLLYNSLLGLKSIPCKILLSSWSDPAFTKMEQKELFEKSLAYLERLDKGVKKYYTLEDDFALSNCRNLVQSMGFPDFFINPLVNRALKTHLD